MANSFSAHLKDFKCGGILGMTLTDLHGCKLVSSWPKKNRNYIKKEIGKLLSEIWRIKGLSEQEYGSNHPITKKLGIIREEAQALLQEK